MKWDRVYKEKHFATADDLLAELNPSQRAPGPLDGSLWYLNRNVLAEQQTWIFRGVWDASLPLRPSAFRPGVFEPFAPPGKDILPIASASDQRDREDHALVTFCTEADHLGFHIPGDRSELRDPRLAVERYDEHRFPPIEKLHMAALAQHYGVPTRLLDWTRMPLVAAYFAVEKFTRLEAPIHADHRCVVWALNQNMIQDMAKQSVRHDSQTPKPALPWLDPTIYCVTAPTASNPNLAAQGGVFTLVQPRIGDPHPIPDIDQALVPLAEKIPNQWTGPFFCKFTLPATQARFALRLLAAQGVHAGTIYPGLKGVMEMFRERRHHHIVAAPPLIKGGP